MCFYTNNKDSLKGYKTKNEFSHMVRALIQTDIFHILQINAQIINMKYSCENLHIKRIHT